MRLASFYFIVMPLLLSSCASIAPTTHCPKQSIGQCQSMSEINALVDQGAFDEPVNSKKTIPEFKKNTPTPAQIFHAIDTDSPERLPETILKIWLAPYEDSMGNYISDHTLFTVVQAAYWRDQYK